MQSILITGKNKEIVEKKALEICSVEKISKFDTDILETEKQVGIGDIRLLQKKIFLKPIESEKKAIIIKAFLGITIEAQNAFLKTLEEPPNNTIIIILADSLDFFLPTVLSRCSLLEIKEDKLLKNNFEENIEILKVLKKGSVSDALFLAQENSKDKEKALLFLEELIISVHSLIGGKTKDFTNLEIKIMLKNMQKTHTIIKTTNINPRFALENLLLNLFKNKITK